MGAQPREIARLLWLLQPDDHATTDRAERIRLGREGLALLGDDTECAEAALMLFLAAGWSEGVGRAVGESRALLLRAEALAERLPYPAAWAWTDGQKDFSDLLAHFAFAYVAERNAAEGLRLSRFLQELAARHHDDVVLAGSGAMQEGFTHFNSGNFRAGLEVAQHARALLTGFDTFNERVMCMSMSEACLVLGDLAGAEEHARAGRALFGAERSPMFARLTSSLALVALRRGDRAAAIAGLEEARDVCRTLGFTPGEVVFVAMLGHLALTNGDQATAAGHHEEALRLSEAEPDALGGYMLAYLAADLDAAGRPAPAWQRLERVSREHPAGGLPPVQLALHPALPRALPRVEPVAFSAPAALPWTWHDPLADCGYAPREQGGIEIRAAPGRCLVGGNVSAPRLLRPAPAGAYAVQTVCGAARADRPANGGLLLWADQDNYVLLERGLFSPASVGLRGCLAGRDVLIGFGALPGERLWLRLEREGATVRALCSADGVAWLTPGEIDFPVRDGEQVGLVAMSFLDPVIYPGVYPEGMAIAFAAFSLSTTDTSDGSP
jgi:hypothetical protein